MAALRDGFGGLGNEVLYEARVQCPLRLQLLWPLQPIGRKASARETERKDKRRLYAQDTASMPAGCYLRQIATVSCSKTDHLVPVAAISRAA